MFAVVYRAAPMELEDKMVCGYASIFPTPSAGGRRG
jgi:hypothetical protein